MKNFRLEATEVATGKRIYLERGEVEPSIEVLKAENAKLRKLLTELNIPLPEGVS